MEQLQERQMALQDLFGGNPIKYVHLTCQRFAPEDGEQMQAFVQQLGAIAAGMEPFSLRAVSLETLYSRARETNILKWRVEVSEALREFGRAVRGALEACGIASLYMPGSIANLVTALKDVQEVNEADLSKYGELPYRLFDVEKVVLSKILGPNDYEILAKLKWGR